MTVLRSVTCPTWPLTVGSVTATQTRPATLPAPAPAPARGSSPTHFAAAAARALRVDPAQLVDDDRRAPVVLARQLAMVCARRAGYSLNEIGNAFGRSHTTVLYAQRTLADRALRDPAIEQLLRWITDTANGATLGRPEPPHPAKRTRPAVARAPRRSTPPTCGVDERLGSYGERRVTLSVRGGNRVLLDCREDGSDERVIERLATGVKRPQIVAIAHDYLAQARRRRAPLARSVA